MIIKQLSVFVENRRGKLNEIVQTLSDAGVDLRALMLADTSEFGFLRMIVSDPDLACDILKKAGMMIRVSDVVAFGMTDKPGEFTKVTQLIAAEGVDISYLYTLASPKNGEAVIILQMDQPGAGIAALRKGGFRIIGPDEIYNG